MKEVSMLDDYMVRAIAGSKQIRAFAATTGHTVEEARKAHGTSPVATAVLGRTLTGALLMSDLLKSDDDLLTIQFDGDGPIGGITVTADSHGNVKGYVKNPLVLLPPKENGHLDVGRAVGKGTLTVIRDLDRDNTYNGQVAIHSGEIADDLTHYFAESEQVPTSISLGVLVDTDCTVRQAGGFLIQLMPFTEDEVIRTLEQNLGKTKSITEMLEDGATPEEMLGFALDGLDVTFEGKMPVQFHCNCDRPRVEKALILLGKDELLSMAKEGHDFDLSCQFCGKKYTFSPSELVKLSEEAERK
jgi:molecular chaperone Hsp33